MRLGDEIKDDKTIRAVVLVDDFIGSGKTVANALVRSGPSSVVTFSSSRLRSVGFQRLGRSRAWGSGGAELGLRVEELIAHVVAASLRSNSTVSGIPLIANREELNVTTLDGPDLTQRVGDGLSRADEVVDKYDRADGLCRP